MPNKTQETATTNSATFRMYGELNDFLKPEQRFCSFVHRFKLPSTTKDMIEAIGVPHPELEVILLNGAPVDFCRMVKDGDRVAAYPALEMPEMNSLPRLREPLREYRFVLDGHLGKLARYLRLLGFDSLYDRDADDKWLAEVSHREQRILLTRDCGLLKRSEVVYGRFLRATEIRQQVVEVLGRFPLREKIAAFSRCMECNGAVQEMEKQAVMDRLERRTREHYEEFRQCMNCGRVYWAGSHHERMSEFIASVLSHVTVDRE